MALMGESLTDKQIALKDYLLQRLGFKSNDDFMYAYVEQLYKVAHNHVLLAAVEDKDYSEEEYPYHFQVAPGDIWMPYKFGIVDLLMWEYKLKKEASFKDKFNNNKYFSATDLANYIFCGVGYSISKSFEGTRNLGAERGTVYHEQKVLQVEERLLFEYKQTLNIEDEPIYIDDRNRYFFNEIAKSTIIYSGHADGNEQKYFVNEQKRFAGQPDYIFKNAKGQYYVVEEKFKVLRESQGYHFADSHKVQLASYIHYLKEYDIQYGYLVYWTYRLGDYYIKHLQNCYVLKVSKDSNIEDYLDTLVSKLTEIEGRGYLNLNVEKLNPKKCASCAHVVICSHKNKRNNQVKIPYDKGYFKLYYAPYPEILKKKEESPADDIL